MLWYFGLALSVVAFIVGMRFRKDPTKPWAPSLTGFAAIMVVLCSIASVFDKSSSPAARLDAVAARDAAFELAAWQQVGEYIAEKYPGSNILLIARPSIAEFNKIQEDKFVAALEGALDSGSKIVGTERLEFPEGVPPSRGRLTEGYIKQIWTGEQLDGWLKEYAYYATLTVSAVGLPERLGRSVAWVPRDPTKRNVERPPYMILMGAMDPRVQAALSTGAITAAVEEKPGFRVRAVESVPKSNEAAFKQRYVLVDQTNLAEVLQEYPGLFR